MNETHEYIPRPGEYDPLSTSPSRPEASGPTQVPGTSASKIMIPRPMIEFRKPSELLRYVEPEGQNLAGNYHLQRGAPTILAGPPGTGKSRATLWLASLGAVGTGSWFGLPVHTQFRTLVIQSENSEGRLHRDFITMEGAERWDDWVCISVFPAFRGFQFANPAFREELKRKMRDFAPDLVILDPWNNVVRDSMEKDFLEGMDHIRDILAERPEAACLILHHLRKPRNDDKHKGRNLSHLLSGSYVLVSTARAVLVMQPASDDTEDDRVVLTVAKNNDGELGPRTAWRRRTGWFDPVVDFDFEAFDGGSVGTREQRITDAEIKALFHDGKARKRSKAVEELQKIANCGRTAAYAALKFPNGPFDHLLEEDLATGAVRLKAT